MSPKFPVRSVRVIDIEKLPIRVLSYDEFKQIVMLQTETPTSMPTLLVELVKCSTGLTKDDIESRLTMRDYQTLLAKIVSTNSSWFGYDKDTAQSILSKV